MKSPSEVKKILKDEGFNVETRNDTLDIFDFDLWYNTVVRPKFPDFHDKARRILSKTEDDIKNNTELKRNIDFDKALDSYMYFIFNRAATVPAGVYIYLLTGNPEKTLGIYEYTIVGHEKHAAQAIQHVASKIIEHKPYAVIVSHDLVTNSQLNDVKKSDDEKREHTPAYRLITIQMPKWVCAIAIPIDDIRANPRFTIENLHDAEVEVISPAQYGSALNFTFLLNEIREA